MTDLELLRERIPGYADYADGDARHDVDKQVRAYLGEALAGARDRVRPQGALAERLDGEILRCQFSDQREIRAVDHARFDPRLVARVHALDRELVTIADRVRDITEADQLGVALDDAARAFDERLGAIADGVPDERA